MTEGQKRGGVGNHLRTFTKEARPSHGKSEANSIQGTFIPRRKTLRVKSSKDRPTGNHSANLKSLLATGIAHRLQNAIKGNEKKAGDCKTLAG